MAELIRSHALDEKACVVGLSEGAQIAVQLLASAPELVEKAIISSAILRPVPGLAWAKSPALLTWSYRISIPPFRNVDWWIHLNMKYAAGIPNVFYPEFKKDFQEMTESEFVNLMLANQKYRLPSGLDKATAPTLMVAGQKEYPAMKQSVRDLVGALPNCQGGFINLGKKSSMTKEHNWAMTAPDKFATTVRAWIENQSLPAVIERLGS